MQTESQAQPQPGEWYRRLSARLRLPEGDKDLESLIRQLNHSAPSPRQLWTTLVTDLLTAAGCESRLSQHAVASIHRLRRAPEVMDFVTTGFDPKVTQVLPGASAPETSGEETDQQGHVPDTRPTDNGQQKYDDQGKSAPVRELFSETLLDGARPKRSPIEAKVLTIFISTQMTSLAI
ncbi:hypothetical protein C0Q70_00678 [Pomacea canaliculata]|uniref:Uncharacterized protein n=1 Tax=Pomacea canaliculata TaxID=400727 RepID=A0A2T7PXF6_POMCA|nr:hypothetical protein C0Q70_00678 [Pomacea canaliculata]